MAAMASRSIIARCAATTTARSNCAQRAWSWPMTKAWTDSALVTTPFSVRPSSPHEKETEPDGKKLSPNCKSAMAAATSLIARHLDLTRAQSRFEAREVVFGRSLHSDKDSAKL